MPEPLKKYKTFWRRLLASVIDGIVFIPIVLLETLIIFGSVSMDTLMGNDLTDYPASPMIILFVTNTILTFSYSVWMTQRFGQTLGKMATKIIILDEETESHPITTKYAIWRDLPLIVADTLAIAYMIITQDVSEESVAMKVLSFASGIWVLAELISMFQNDRRRAIHDIFAHSVVVRLESKKEVSQATA